MEVLVEKKYILFMIFLMIIWSLMSLVRMGGGGGRVVKVVAFEPSTNTPAIGIVGNQVRIGDRGLSETGAAAATRCTATSDHLRRRDHRCVVSCETVGAARA